MPRQKSAISSFELLPNEMFLQIFSYLDFETALKARCVNRKWQALIDISRDLEFICQLTDETISTVVNAREALPHVKIHKLLESVGVCTSTRGVGKIMGAADHLEVFGKEINAEELRKVLRFAKSLQSLSFVGCRSFVVKSLLSSTWTYQKLTKLSFLFSKLPKKWHTHFLEKLPEHSAMFPSVQHLKIVYRMDSLVSRNIPSINDLFRNYLAMANAIIGFKTTLKRVELIRSDIVRTVLLVQQQDNNQFRLNEARRNEVAQCVNGLEEVQLEELHLTPVINEGHYPWILETTLLRAQRELKEITINRKLSPPVRGSVDVTRVIPVNLTFLTSIKIAVTSFDDGPIDLRLFSQCPKLNTLWLAYYRGVRIGPARQNTLQFTNVEHLPVALTNLHFKSSQEDAVIIHQQSILSRNQMRWLIDNLRNLESLWLQLVADETEQQGNAHGGNEAPPLEVVNPENIEQDDNHQADQQEAAEAEHLLRRLNEELNVNANMDTTTFKELIRMPKLQEMKFDMMKAGQLASILEIGADGNPWILPMGLRVTSDDIREYIDICQEERGISFTTTRTNFFPFGFIELTILKKKSKPKAYFTS